MGLPWALRLLLLGCLLPSLHAAEAARKTFAIPADEAEDALETFSDQADTQVVYLIQDVRGVATNAVSGRFAIREALERLVAGTGLRVEQEEKSGAFIVKRDRAPRPPAQHDSTPTHPTNPDPMKPRTFLSALAGWLAASGAADAQTPPPAPSVVQLSPFEVVGDKDNSYGALNSNSVTRFNAELEKLPVTADIFTQAFMDDVGTSSIESMLGTFSAGSGKAATDPTTSSGMADGDHVAHTYTQLRGFNTTIMQRDSLMPVGPLYNPGATAPGVTSNFDVERVEVINGPQALLYSGGGPGGVINVVSKQARFDKPLGGSVRFKVDQFGSKEEQLDVGFGNRQVAFRFATLNDDQKTRRVDVGRLVGGYYGQIAVKVFDTTTIRLNAGGTAEHGMLGGAATLTTNATLDNRSATSLSYLLATNQTGANTLNTTGLPNVSGALLNGKLNWGNIGSLSGWLRTEKTIAETESLSVTTVWSPHISSEISAGYTFTDYAFRDVGSVLSAPQAPANPTGDWAISGAPNETDEPAHTKALRASIVATNDLFGGRAHAQTIFGADYVSTRAFSISYSYFQADANFNVIYSPTAPATTNGRIALTTQYYPIGGGVQKYPLMSLGATRVTLNGVNYARQSTNQANPALVSPTNPLGLPATNLNQHNELVNKGVFVVNLTEWMDGKLNTLAGVRANGNFDSQLQGPPTPYRLSRINSVDYDVGVDYALNKWVRPYVSLSDAITPPQVLTPDPAGVTPQAGRGLGGEIGLKFGNVKHTVSGSVAFYVAKGSNEQYTVPAALQTDINPTGLNGRDPIGTYVDIDRFAKGVQLNLTANPTSNWRLRFSAAEADGTVGSTKTYGQVYNDQFYQNSAGQVTYADKSLVYVAPTFNAKQPVVTSATAGAIPLTIAMMNFPASVYFANPTNPTGAINASSAVATVLKTVDPVHGAILTGATGLPISAMQITPPFALPGTINAFTKGDQTFGFPKLSANLTSVYTFAHGPLKGLDLGGTVSGSWRALQYYYYPNGYTPGGARLPFYAPTSGRADLIVGYSHKIGRYVWRSQLNVNNLFNHYDVVVKPNQTTGFSAGSLTAAFYGEPRSYQWTNSIRF
jgi:outer membrane receptor protein involved in Fe transport